MNQVTKNNIQQRSRSSQILGDSLVMAVANILTLILGLAIAIVATRKFTADAYGNFILLYLVSTFLTQISTLGLSVSVSKNLATMDNSEERAKLANLNLTLRLIMVGITCILSVLIAPYLFNFIGAKLDESSLIYVIIFFICDSLTYTLQSNLQGFFRFKQIAIWNFSSSLLNIIFLFIFSFLPLTGLGILVFARWVAYMLAGFYLFFSLPIKKQLVFDWQLAKELIKFGYPLQINDILSYFYNRIDSIMIAFMLGTANVAYFEIARKIPDSLISFFDSFRMVFFPTFAKFYASDEKGNAESLLRNALRVTTFACLSIAYFTYLFGKDIINLLFSSKYVLIVPSFFVMMISVCFILIGYLLGNSLVAVGESDKPAKINIVHVVISLGSNLLLISPLGILGAAITRIIGPIATNPLNYFFLHRKFKVDVLSAYLKPSIIFTIWFGLTFLLPINTLFLKSIALIGFIFVNFVFSVMTKNDFIFLRFEAQKIIRNPSYLLSRN
jgi:O-antigen/teichoic acid export membrane protein